MILGFFYAFFFRGDGLLSQEVFGGVQSSRASIISPNGSHRATISTNISSWLGHKRTNASAITTALLIMRYSQVSPTIH